MNKKYPFHPSLKNHLIIALALALWIFVFLYFTEPLDVSEFGKVEKLIYLPLYGIAGAFCYIIILPAQYWLYNRNNKQWFWLQELSFLLSLLLLGFLLMRVVYLYIVMKEEPNPYSLGYYLVSIYAPAALTIFPILIIGRWSFGKYREKKQEDQKIEITGVGQYESIRLLFNDIICIQSSDNYIEVSFLQQGTLKKQLLRNKLSVIETEFPELVRTHRSFLINPYHFCQWKTEKNKLQIILEYDIIVPVSKTFQDKVKSYFNFTTK